MILRILAGLALVLGLFFLPWAFVFGAAVIAAAFFPWYLEVLLIGLLSASIAGADPWKLFLVLSLVVLGEEWLKSRISASQSFSTAWAGVLGGIIFLLSAFVFL